MFITFGLTHETRRNRNRNRRERKKNGNEWFPLFFICVFIRALWFVEPATWYPLAMDWWNKHTLEMIICAIKFKASVNWQSVQIFIFLFLLLCKQMSTWILNLQLRLLFFFSLSLRGFNAKRWDLNAFCVFSSAFLSNAQHKEISGSVWIAPKASECNTEWMKGVFSFRITEVNEIVENCSAHSNAANVLTYENTY